MNEFQLTLTNYAARQGINISELAKRLGYDPLVIEKTVIGQNRRIPVDFFIRIAEVLNLTTREKDALVRSWAFGTYHWNWPQSDKGSLRKPARKAG